MWVVTCSCGNKRSKQIVTLLTGYAVSVTTEKQFPLGRTRTGQVRQCITDTLVSNPRGQGGCDVRNRGQYPLHRKCRKHGSDPPRHRLAACNEGRKEKQRGKRNKKKRLNDSLMKTTPKKSKHILLFLRCMDVTFRKSPVYKHCFRHHMGSMSGFSGHRSLFIHLSYVQTFSELVFQYKGYSFI